MFVYIRGLWGGCKEVKSTCAIKLFVDNEITANTDQSQACSSLQGDAQQTLAYDMMHCSPEKTMSSYDEHVCLTISRALVENHCFNMSEQ